MYLSCLIESSHYKDYRRKKIADGGKLKPVHIAGGKRLLTLFKMLLSHTILFKNAGVI
jgi:hypothetical protein